MVMTGYFLNHKDFKSKKDGKEYHVLTICDGNGDVSEFFHDTDIVVPECELFTELDLEVSVSKYRGNTRIDLVSVDIPVR